ncbi:MAG: hypothetical protein KME35_06560 [Aphanocapsa sp. GSE-SYN-MK-11-07L]|nr:hypothetical protein [Aphanocapsa sp. GSE-SYN-MK-11-07L]
MPQPVGYEKVQFVAAEEQQLAKLIQLAIAGFKVCDRTSRSSSLERLQLTQKRHR